jgi:hypothetical protein
MNQIIEFFARSPWAIVGLCGFVLSAAVSVLCRKQITFRAMDMLYTMPFFGRINRMSKSPTQSPKQGWTTEEQTLCGDYSQHAKIISERDFLHTLEYLRLAGDIGREPTPGWAWLFIALLVLAEGYGFSYLLGTWVTRDGDANLYRVLAAFLAFVICGLMLWLTHNSGREIQRTGLLRSCKAKFNGGNRSGDPAQDARTRAYFTESMSIGVHHDRDLPMHVQMVNRVASHGSDEGNYAWTTTAVIAMIFIAALSFWMRHENLRRDIIKQESATTQEQTGNPFQTAAIPAPAASAAPVTEKQAQAKADSIDAEKSEGGAAFLMLAGIFILTQIVSIGLGVKYGFAGKQSRRAYDNTQGYVTYSSYYNSPIFRLTQARLQTLQQKMESNSHERQGIGKTYSDYCSEEARHESSIRAMSTDAQYTPTPTAHELAATVNAMPRREDKLAFLATILDDNLRAGVRDSLARSKAASETLAKEEAQFGDVL